VARGDFITIQFLIDIQEAISTDVLRHLKDWSNTVKADLVFQPQNIFQREKRLIVFDMDATIVDGEIIDILAKAAGVEKEVTDLTREAMDGSIGFTESFKRRVKLLCGLPVEVLEEIAGDIRLTPGSEELLIRLKAMGYKTALISGGFTFFTDVLKKQLHFDYAYGNEPEIENGMLTGELKGRIIDAEVKGEIIMELAKIENISPENIVAVGDGANDRLMLENAGLGVAFDAKELLRKVSDGTLSRENIRGILNILGHTGPDN
jgi:phosphoserine phosphatase